MSEWWTYRPDDFLMFAPRTYWRLFALHNAAWWPAQLPWLLAGLGWLCAALLRGQAALRWGAAGLAAASAFVALAFLLPRYAPVNWAATGFAYGWLVQAIALAALALRADLQAVPPGARRHGGTLLCAGALLGWPLLAPAFGRPWLQGEYFGLAPDPTVAATLGFLLWANGTGRATRWLLRLLWTLALAWCCISAATLWTMGSAQGWAVMLTALGAVMIAVVCAVVAARAAPSSRAGFLLRP